MTIKAWVMSFAGVIAAVFVLQLAVMYFTDEAPGAVVLTVERILIPARCRWKR